MPAVSRPRAASALALAGLLVPGAAAAADTKRGPSVARGREDKVVNDQAVEDHQVEVGAHGEIHILHSPHKQPQRNPDGAAADDEAFQKMDPDGAGAASFVEGEGAFEASAGHGDQPESAVEHRGREPEEGNVKAHAQLAPSSVLHANASAAAGTTAGYCDSSYFPNGKPTEPGWKCAVAGIVWGWYECGCESTEEWQLQCKEQGTAQIDGDTKEVKRCCAATDSLPWPMSLPPLEGAFKDAQNTILEKVGDEYVLTLTDHAGSRAEHFEKMMQNFANNYNDPKKPAKHARCCDHEDFTRVELRMLKQDRYGEAGRDYEPIRRTSPSTFEPTGEIANNHIWTCLPKA